jgi:catechol 2,3-dioxygenase-like lactoylglutathione lyase family enzyme
MAGVKLIHHVNVQIRHRQRTREWYEQVLGAEFLDRGPLNPRQLQLRIGTGEMHFTETSEPVATGHFAVEVDDWEGMLANLERLGVSYTRAPGATQVGPPRTPEDTPDQGRREDNGEHYTYVQDPDGNVIELVYHPLGLEDADGKRVELPDTSKRLRWKQKEGFVHAG